MTIIGLIGRYGVGAQQDLPNWIDLLVVPIFSLIIFSYAVSLAMTREQIQETVRKEERAIESPEDLRTA